MSRNFWDNRDSRRPPGEAWRSGDGPIRRTVSGARIVWRMLIAAVLCLCAAAAIAGLGLWLLARPIAADPVRQVLRAVAPTQLAAAVMLAAGGVVALSAEPQTGLIVVVVCAVGAVCTVGAGCWQSAKAVAASAAQSTGARREAAGRAPGLRGDCGGACATCTLSCN